MKITERYIDLLSFSDFIPFIAFTLFIHLHFANRFRFNFVTLSSLLMAEGPLPRFACLRSLTSSLFVPRSLPSFHSIPLQFIEIHEVWIMVPDESLLRYDLYLHKFFSCCLFVHCRAGRTMPCWWPAWYLHSYPPFGWLIDWWSATLTFTVHYSAVVSYSALLPVIEFTSFAVLLLKLNYVFVVGWIDIN